jgi:prepilin-type N-terminal cleavage/methylation domain-containing protein
LLCILRGGVRGFTFIELLVVIAALAVLGTLFLPVMVHAKGKSMSMSAQCLNNHKQLITAAIMYADDNQDWWPLNQTGGFAWCINSMDFNTLNTDNTNLIRAVTPPISVLGPWLPGPNVLHCPADKSFVTGLGQRIRSVSMSQAVGSSANSVCGQPVPCAVNGQWLSGNNVGGGCNTSGFRTYGKTAQMTAPSPANLWVFADEHPNSINDGQLAVQCALTGPFSTIIDYPANYHAGAGTFSFADSHTELHKWTGQGIQPPANFSAGSLTGGHPANDSAINDVPWLQFHTSAK